MDADRLRVTAAGSDWLARKGHGGGGAFLFLEKAFPFSGLGKYAFPLTKQKFFAVIENASVAGNPRLTCPEGPHLPRPLPLGVFLSDQEVRWGQTKMKHR